MEKWHLLSFGFYTSTDKLNFFLGTTSERVIAYWDLFFNTPIVILSKKSTYVHKYFVDTENRPRFLEENELFHYFRSEYGKPTDELEKSNDYPDDEVEWWINTQLFERGWEPFTWGQSQYFRKLRKKE